MVILVERDNYEKRRPGEHLAGRIRGPLDELRISTDDARVISVASPGILSLWNGAAPLTKPYAASGQQDALCVTRHRFDERLFRSAGTQVQQLFHAQDSTASLALRSAVGTSP